MDRRLAALALTGVLLVGALAATGGALGGASAQASDQSNQSDQSTATVSASATGEVTADPDRAVVYLAATATGDNASEATDRLAANVSRLRDTLDDENLSVVSVNTTAYSVTERGETPGRDGGNRTYVARQSFAVTTDDVNGTGDVIDAAVGGGASEVFGVEFTLSDERREERRADAIDDAVTDARAQAEAGADSAGLALGGVDSLSVTADRGGIGFRPVEEAAAADGTSIDPTPVTVSASVRVTYNATND